MNIIDIINIIIIVVHWLLLFIDYCNVIVQVLISKTVVAPEPEALIMADFISGSGEAEDSGSRYVPGRFDSEPDRAYNPHAYPRIPQRYDDSAPDTDNASGSGDSEDDWQDVRPPYHNNNNHNNNNHNNHNNNNNHQGRFPHLRLQPWPWCSGDGAATAIYRDRRQPDANSTSSDSSLQVRATLERRTPPPARTTRSPGADASGSALPAGGCPRASSSSAGSCSATPSTDDVTHTGTPVTSPITNNQRPLSIN